MIMVSLCINLSCAVYLFLYMKKKRDLHQRTLVALTLCVSSVIGFVISMNVQLVILQVQNSILIATVTSCLIGALFGLIHSKTCGMTGYYHGLTAGLMGSMLSLVIHNPSVCHLPVYYANSIEQQSILFSIFSCIVSFATVFLVQFVHWKADKDVRNKKPHFR